MEKVLSNNWDISSSRNETKSSDNINIWRDLEDNKQNSKILTTLPQTFLNNIEFDKIDDNISFSFPTPSPSGYYAWL